MCVVTPGLTLSASVAGPPRATDAAAWLVVGVSPPPPPPSPAPHREDHRLPANDRVDAKAVPREPDGREEVEGGGREGAAGPEGVRGAADGAAAAGRRPGVGGRGGGGPPGGPGEAAKARPPAGAGIVRAVLREEGWGAAAFGVKV